MVSSIQIFFFAGKPSLSLSLSLSLFSFFIFVATIVMSTTKKYCGDKFSHHSSEERYQTSTFPHTMMAPLALSKTEHQSGKSTMQTLSLISFIEKYSSSLPIRVRVVEGYSGRNDR